MMTLLSSLANATLETMRREHREHEPQLESLLKTFRILLASPERLTDLGETLLSAASTLEHDFVAHLQEEEQIVLRRIQSLLTDEQRQTMLDELRARRSGVNA
jgi:hemerythrin-like domain-containing protein